MRKGSVQVNLLIPFGLHALITAEAKVQAISVSELYSRLIKSGFLSNALEKLQENLRDDKGGELV